MTMDQTITIDKSTAVLRYIVAFSYDTGSASFEDLCTAISGQESWISSDLWFREIEQDLYDYILNQVSSRNDKTNIGSAWLYKDIPSLPALSYRQRNDDRTFNISFSDMGLFMFRSNVGLLWYEIDAPDFDNVPDLIRFQKYFKELNFEKNLQQFSVISGDPAGTAFHMGAFLDDIIRSLPCDIRYFAQRKCIVDHRDSAGSDLAVPDKAILFTCLTRQSESEVIEDHDPELIDWLYCLTGGHSMRHLIPEDMEDNYYHPFRNVYWDVTNEGCACCAKYNSSNSIFFTKRFTMRFRHDYFFIFVILMHQSYSLLNYSTWIERNLPADQNEYLSYAEMNRNKIEHFLLSMNTFLSKNIYASVSHIQHHNDFYAYGIKRLKIKESAENLNLGTDAIREILEVHENRREASADSSRNYLFGVLSILIVFSALTDANSLFDIPHDQRLSNPFFWVIMVFIVALCISTVVRLMVMAWKNRKRK